MGGADVLSQLYTEIDELNRRITRLQKEKKEEHRRMQILVELLNDLRNDLNKITAYAHQMQDALKNIWDVDKNSRDTYIDEEDKNLTKDAIQLKNAWREIRTALERNKLLETLENAKRKIEIANGQEETDTKTKTDQKS